jgi:hypothetical protein
MLQEYNSLRQESLSSITNRITIASFTFGAVAVILAALISRDNPSPLTGLIAFILVPQVSKAGLMIWLGEYNRSQRAGKWVAHLEEKINRALGWRKVLNWEAALVGNDVHMTYPYRSVAVLLIGIGWASIVAGASILINDFGAKLLIPAYLAGAIVVTVTIAATEIAFIVFFRRKWRRIKLDYSKE